MKRIDLKELHERELCPALLRDSLTDFLAFFSEYSHIYSSAESMIAKALGGLSSKNMVDLCAGSGFYDFHLLKRMRKIFPEARLMLTDKYPNKTWSGLAELSGNTLFFRGKLDAASALEKEDGLFVMFSALHHFSENELSDILERSAVKKCRILFFDYSKRDFFSEIAPMLFLPLFIWLTSFLIYPFLWKRLFITYIIPVLPFMILFDGIVSRMKSYTLPELKKITDSVKKSEDYSFESGVVPVYGGFAKIHYISGGVSHFEKNINTK